MAFSLLCPLLATALLLMQTLADTSCTDCFVQSRAAYYPNSEVNGTDAGACGFGSFGATANGGDVSAASSLYRNGVGCGACYQTQNFVCKLLDRSHGAVWTTTSAPSGPLSLRMLFSAENGEETWAVPINNIPKDWKAGETYDSGIQVDK